MASHLCRHHILIRPLLGVNSLLSLGLVLCLSSSGIQMRSTDQPLLRRLIFSLLFQNTQVSKSAADPNLWWKQASEDGRWRPADGACGAGQGAGRWRVHLAGGAEPLQQERPVAGDRSEGVQHYSVGQKAPGRDPGHQPLRRRECHGDLLPRL